MKKKIPTVRKQWHQREISTESYDEIWHTETEIKAFWQKK